jgi:hypothetical protein
VVLPQPAGAATVQTIEGIRPRPKRVSINGMPILKREISISPMSIVPIEAKEVSLSPIFIVAIYSPEGGCTYVFGLVNRV